MRGERSFWAILGGVLILGVGLRILPQLGTAHYDVLGAEIRNAVGEALIVAAMLAAIVDRYAKGRLTHEVAERVAAKMHGYHLPPEVQQKLNTFYGLTFIARNLCWDITITPGDRGDKSLIWTWTLSYEIENVERTAQRFRQRTRTSSFDQNDIDRVSIIEVAHRYNGDLDYCYHGGDEEYELGYDESDRVKTWENPTGVLIESRAKPGCGIHKFHSVIRMRVNEGEIREISLRYPTINAQMMVTRPAEYAVLTAMDLDGIKPHQTYERAGACVWESHKVYLPGERFWIQVRRSDSSDPTERARLEYEATK